MRYSKEAAEAGGDPCLPAFRVFSPKARLKPKTRLNGAGQWRWPDFPNNRKLRRLGAAPSRPLGPRRRAGLGGLPSEPSRASNGPRGRTVGEHPEPPSNPPTREEVAHRRAGTSRIPLGHVLARVCDMTPEPYRPRRRDKSPDKRLPGRGSPKAGPVHRSGLVLAIRRQGIFTVILRPISMYSWIGGSKYRGLIRPPNIGAQTSKQG